MHWRGVADTADRINSFVVFLEHFLFARTDRRDLSRRNEVKTVQADHSIRNSMHVVDGFLSENLKNKVRLLHFQNGLRSSRPKVVSPEVMSFEIFS